MPPRTFNQILEDLSPPDSQPAKSICPDLEDDLTIRFNLMGVNIDSENQDARDASLYISGLCRHKVI